jgi:ABC-2 type transport system ATP-binding protein
MEQVEEICDHIILMNKGQKILDGTVGGVQQQFKENLFRIGLAGDVGDSGIAGASDVAKGTDGTNAANGADVFQVVGRSDNNIVVKIRDGHRPNDVLRYYMDHGAEIQSFTEMLPSLSDIFIRLVEGTPLARKFEKN